MRVRVLFFGMLRELVGRPSEDADFPQGADLRAVFESYAARYPRLRELAASIVVAHNQEFAQLSTSLAEGDEVAFLPPVSGGSADGVELSQDGHYFALTCHAIDTRAVIARLLTGAEGAVVPFEDLRTFHTVVKAQRVWLDVTPEGDLMVWCVVPMDEVQLAQQQRKRAREEQQQQPQKRGQFIP